jgi:hypothetical protein
MPEVLMPTAPLRPKVKAQLLVTLPKKLDVPAMACVEDPSTTAAAAIDIKIMDVFLFTQGILPSIKFEGGLNAYSLKGLIIARRKH